MSGKTSARSMPFFGRMLSRTQSVGCVLFGKSIGELVLPEG